MPSHNKTWPPRSACKDGVFKSEEICGTCPRKQLENNPFFREEKTATPEELYNSFIDNQIAYLKRLRGGGDGIDRGHGISRYRRRK